MNKLSHNQRLNQAGFAHVALVLVVLVFIAIGFIGYKLYANPAHPVTSTTTSTGTPKLNTAVAPQVKTNTDLDKASSVLDANDPTTTSASDASYLDAQTQVLQ